MIGASDSRMAFVFPDTNIVIGRVKEKDALHQECVIALRRYAGESIKLLYEVYEEAAEVIQTKNLRAVRYIHQAYGEANQANASQEIEEQELERIIRRARFLAGGRNEGFFEGILDFMKVWLAEGRDPFLSLDKIFRITMKRELRELDNLFGILSPAEDVINYTKEEIGESEKVEKALERSDRFFAKDKRDRDKRIACQMLTVGARSEFDLFDALLEDGDFAKALERVRRSPAEEFTAGASKMTVRRLAS